MLRKYQVVDRVVAHLANIGSDYIFGVDGANIEDLYDAAPFNPDITAVLAKHEFSAGTKAAGYSRSGAGLGVVAATSGGGARNFVAALGESLTSRVPVLARVGQSASTMAGRGSFQDISGHHGVLDAQAVLTRAIAAARRRGPAVLLLPKAATWSTRRSRSTWTAPSPTTGSSRVRWR
jgi:acetolactate synthase-1/2/3 large subunit